MTQPADHAFVPFVYGGEEICAEAVDGRCCGRYEYEHAPATETAQAELLEDENV
jgi:hypothetical protein